MPHTIRDEIELDAPPADVWRVLTDTAAYLDWNPFVTRLTGDLAVGGRLEVHIAPPGGRAMTFRPTVTVVRPERELRWLGRLLLPRLFDGEHAFELEPLADGRTRLVQSETFSGVLVPLLRRMLEPTRQGFVAMDHALKAEVARRGARPVDS
jgi:hypothetical protein